MITAPNNLEKNQATIKISIKTAKIII